MKDSQYNNHKKHKVQSIYRKTKQQNREDYRKTKIGTAIVSVCVFIMLIIFVMSSLFDSGVRFAQFWGK